MKKVTAALLGLAAGAVAWALRDIPAALGGTPGGERVRRSPQFRDGRFHNASRTRTMPPGGTGDTARELFFGGQQRHPAGEVPLVPAAPGASASGLHITWYGHASTLVEIDGARVLIDPVWSDRCSPSRLVGPKRLHAVPHELSEVGQVDAVVISHDHYDHLDLPTVRALTRSGDAVFVVPLGIGAHLRRWKVPEDRIVELDWDESHEVAGVRLVASPAQHFSGRGFQRDNTLWASWAIVGPEHRVYYSGDTGYFDGYQRIGEEYGPFDAALIQVGAYGPGWPDIHMTPEEGVAAHREVRGGLLIPVHWATFNLAFHDWAEPVDRVWREAKAWEIPLAIPRPGERIDVNDPPAVDGWWQALV
ncbi:L-ascorbate metabolism protein UlaG (beta-lactamase superfamily) [Saccharothrix tamanrassetensis]|uniref:L-ascorbate metabolism protein UlaG (Beta-lactamase superfamily) n=1 Tax=Saccharothrix tamanrassetensis TaxID=1051531 RepID=A0A841CH32_9PSEU|nr:MBL fold metallo-hydrolase [Saccharothrix tamanrassetensis]MBB5955478.1 L-ascorbate metabolism protein UlaG (beta-lactamase superfamily) [Saccharothrix tamanrassetensis]